MNSQQIEFETKINAKRKEVLNKNNSFKEKIDQIKILTDIMDGKKHDIQGITDTEIKKGVGAWLNELNKAEKKRVNIITEITTASKELQENKEISIKILSNGYPLKDIKFENEKIIK